VISPGEHVFDCQMYVTKSGNLQLYVPQEAGPTKLARLEHLTISDLQDPGFRRLLGAFQKVTSPLPFQV
jgi:hypothetical protein